MPQAKPHLKSLFRTPILEDSRRGFLRLDMNESVSGLPDDFVKSILAKIDSECVASYPEYKAFQEKVAAYNNLQPENICLSNGSDAAIKYIFDAYVSPGDKVLLTDPTFAMYPVYSQMFRAQAVTIPYNGDFTFPLDAFLRCIIPDIRIAVVVNPNNPTGVALEPSCMQKIIAKCEREDVLLVLDEAYFYFCDKTAIDEIKKYQNLIVLRTFSKLCSLATLRLGYAAACSDIVENLRKVKPTYDVNGIAVLFAEKILDHPYIIQGLIRSVRKGKEYLTQKLAGEGIEYREGNANFILIKCNERVDEIIRKLAAKKILVSGGFKQDFLKDYIRVNIGDKITMKQFWDVFIDIWREKD